MKIRNFILALSALALFGSCYDDENDDPKFPESNEVKFRSLIAGQVTYAENNVWHPGDAIGIYMGDFYPEAEQDVITGNKHYTTAGNGSFTPNGQGNTIFYPTTRNEVDFVAYYPYSADIDEDYNYTIDVKNQSDQPAIDFLFSNNVMAHPKGQLVELNFYHKLSKIIFKIIPGEGLTQADLDNLEVKIDGFNTKGRMMVLWGALDPNTTEPAEIVARDAAPGALYDAIVLPTIVNWAEVIFDLKNAEGDRFTWAIPTDTEFEQAKKYTFTVTIKRTDVSVVGTIEDWVDGTGGEVIAD